MADKKIIMEFFQTPSGREPVREWLEGLTPYEQEEIEVAIAKVEIDYPGPPKHCTPLQKGIWEVRAKLNKGGKKEARILFCVIENRMILLDGYFKKKWKTDIDTALERMKRIKL